MLVLPINKTVLIEKNVEYIKEMDKWRETVILENKYNKNEENLKHNFIFNIEETNLWNIPNYPNNFSNITSLNIVEKINGEDITTNISVTVENNSTILTINGAEIIINNLTDKSQLILKPQLIDSISYWTIIYDNEIIASFLAEKMPNNYINNMMFNVKDINVDENNKLIFESELNI